MTLVGVGHALADAFAFVEEDVPKTLGLHPGSFNRVPDYRMRAILATLPHAPFMAGGSAANTVKLAARLGADAHFVGQCGHDPAAQVFESELLNAGVKVSLGRVDAPTGLCVTFLCPSLPRTVATFRSASGNLAPGLLGSTLLAAADVIVLEGYLLDEPDFLEDLLTRCAQARKSVSLDLPPGDWAERHREPLLKHLESGVLRYLFVPEAEASTLTGLDAEGALAALSSADRTVVVKRGEGGWLVGTQGRMAAVDPDGASEVDASGTDEAFQAGFLWATGQGWPAETACQVGSLVAGCISETPGTRVDEQRWLRLTGELARFSSLPKRP